MTGRNERSGELPGFHDTRVPDPAVYALLAFQEGLALVLLLRLEASLEFEEGGEGRIGVDRALARPFAFSLTRIFAPRTLTALLIAISLRTAIGPAFALVKHCTPLRLLFLIGLDCMLNRSFGRCRPFSSWNLGLLVLRAPCVTFPMLRPALTLRPSW